MNTTEDLITTGWLGESGAVEGDRLSQRQERNAAQVDQMGSYSTIDGGPPPIGVEGRAIGRKRLQEVATIASADTILGWFRQLVAKKWTFQRKRQGRPRTRTEMRNLILKMARENVSWGSTRIQGALKNLD